MKLNEAKMRMVYQIESTNQVSALNEIYMTWHCTSSRATKDRRKASKKCPLSNKECTDVIREVQRNYHLPDNKKVDRGRRSGPKWFGKSSGCVSLDSVTDSLHPDREKNPLPHLLCFGELNVRASVIIELRKLYGCTYDDFFEGLDQ